MRDFLNKIRQTRDKAGEDRRRQAEAELQARDEQRTRQRSVDTAAEQIEQYITDRLQDFQSEFVEFLYDASTDRGRHIRVHWNEPSTSGQTGGSRFHQLLFIVRRHHEYADIEVDTKAVIANKELPFRRWEEDIIEGDPERLKSFIDEQILGYTRHYVQQRNW